MQENAFLRNGSSVFEGRTLWPESARQQLWRGLGGYQTSYIFHIENPVRFGREIKVTIEHGHGNHLCNEMSNVAYWYADRPTRVIDPPPVAQRMPILRDNQGKWLYDTERQCPGKPIELNEEMKQMKAQWAARPSERRWF